MDTNKDIKILDIDTDIDANAYMETDIGRCRFRDRYGYGNISKDIGG